MDSVKQSPVTPTKSRFSRTFAKVLSFQAVKLMRKDHNKKTEIPSSEEDGEEKVNDRVIEEAFLAKVFSSISTIKAAYAQMQFSEAPYDAEGIQSSDQTIVSELMNLSELKQCYLKKQFNELSSSPDKALALSEIQELKSLVKLHEISGKKLDLQVKQKEAEITLFKEKLEEENKVFEKSGPANIIQFKDLKATHFIAYYRQVVRSIRSFVRLLVNQMELADLNLDSAASSIEPGVAFWEMNHKCFAFESYVCKQMFDSFNNSSSEGKNREKFFAAFVEMKSASAIGYIERKPKSKFASFCRMKYLKLVHPKMERLVFGNLDQRGLVSGGDVLPETSFFLEFCEMSKRVWMLHCLGMSLGDVSVFQVGKGTRFSEVYMESLSDEAFLACDGGYPDVAFTVVPGFVVGKSIVQAQVYLS